ncbi:MAG: HigA family addiction module antitoxin [Longimicrobiales bacterium]
MIGLPKNRAPTHPGEMLLKEFLKPLNISQSELARMIGVSFQRVHQLIHCKRAMTADTAYRLAKLLGTTPGVWMGLQVTWDLYELQRSVELAEALRSITPHSLKAVTIAHAYSLSPKRTGPKSRKDAGSSAKARGRRASGE